MQYKYYIADVFTNQAFNGAQIAVFPNADSLDPAHMQLLARELNLSETAFFLPITVPKNDEFESLHHFQRLILLVIHSLLSVMF